MPELKTEGLRVCQVEAINNLERSLADNRPRSLIQMATGSGKTYTMVTEARAQLLPEELRPQRRKKFKAYDGTNNIFNLAYEVLQWKVHRAIIKAKMEPYLGFLHSVQVGKPSLVCDLQELYRYLVDDFVVQFCQGLKKRGFMVKSECIPEKDG